MSDAELPEALTLLLDDLTEKTAWMAELERALDTAHAECGDVKAAIAPLLRGLAPEARRAAERRLVAIDRTLPRPEGKVGTTRATKLALRFLAEHEHDEIRAAEMTWYLRRMGVATRPQYAPTLLRDWAKRGVVVRAGHGVYRVNRVHPAVLEHRFAKLKREVDRL